MTSIAAALAHAKALGVDRLDAQLLLARRLGRPRSWLLAHGEDALAPADAASVAADLARRAAGEPLAYLLGEKEFHGLMLEVGPAVLVPRPDTEVLVDWALAVLDAMPDVGAPRVVDLGTGSGAVALALAHARPAAVLTATDNSAAALDVARRNALRLGLAVEFVGGPWWQPLQGRRFHLALSNPPYIAAADPHLDALRHEPIAALTPGGDGLAALREIVAGAAAHLEPGGWLLLEHGHDQAADVQALLRAHGWAQVHSRRDLAGHARCSGGCLG